MPGWVEGLLARGMVARLVVPCILKGYSNQMSVRTISDGVNENGKAAGLRGLRPALQVGGSCVLEAVVEVVLPVVG